MLSFKCLVFFLILFNHINLSVFALTCTKSNQACSECESSGWITKTYTCDGRSSEQCDFVCPEEGFTPSKASALTCTKSNQTCSDCEISGWFTKTYTCDGRSSEQCNFVCPEEVVSESEPHTPLETTEITSGTIDSSTPPVEHTVESDEYEYEDDELEAEKTSSTTTSTELEESAIVVESKTSLSTDDQYQASTTKTSATQSTSTVVSSSTSEESEVVDAEPSLSNELTVASTEVPTQSTSTVVSSSASEESEVVDTETSLSNELAATSTEIAIQGTSTVVSSSVSEESKVADSSISQELIPTASGDGQLTESPPKSISEITVSSSNLTDVQRGRANIINADDAVDVEEKTTVSSAIPSDSFLTTILPESLAGKIAIAAGLGFCVFATVLAIRFFVKKRQRKRLAAQKGGVKLNSIVRNIEHYENERFISSKTESQAATVPGHHDSLESLMKSGASSDDQDAVTNV